MGLLPWDISQILHNFLLWLVDAISTGVLDLTGAIFTTGVEIFLFYRNPRDIPSLNWYWMHSLTVYLAIIVVMLFVYFLTMMLLGDNDDADIHRMVKRFILSGIFLVISRDVFGFFVAVTNRISQYIYPEAYSFAIGADMAAQLANAPASVMGSLLISLIGSATIIVSAGVLLVVLAMRMFLIYVVYATLPVWLGFWVVDVGPAKYGNVMASLLFRVAAVMMMIGIIISAILSVGAAVGAPGATGAATADLADDGGVERFTIMDDGTVVRATGSYAPGYFSGGGSGISAASGYGSIILRLFIYLGSIWVTIALFTSMFGMMMSAGSSTPGGAGGFRGRGGGAAGTGGGAGGAAGGNLNPNNAQRYREGSTGGLNTFRGQESGDIYTVNEAGDGVRFYSDSGPMDADYEVLSGRGSRPDELEQVLGSSGDAPPTLREKGGYLADKLSRGRYSDVKAAGSDVIGGVKGEMGKSSVGSAGLKVGNLLKRGGKAYGKVAMEPTIAGSVARARHIGRASPIARAPPEERIDNYDGYVRAKSVKSHHRAAEGYGWNSGSAKGVKDSNVAASGGSEATVADEAGTGQYRSTGSVSSGGSETTVGGDAGTGRYRSTGSESTGETAKVSDDATATATEEDVTATEDDVTSTESVDDVEVALDEDQFAATKESISELEAFDDDYPYDEYYASVIDESVNVVDDIAENAEKLRQQGHDPQKVMDAATKTGGMVADDVKRAMGGKRVRDHVASTKELESVSARYKGEASVDKLEETLSMDKSEQKAALSKETQDLPVTGPQREVAGKLKSQYRNRDFKSEEERAMYTYHARQVTDGLSKSLERDELAEYNNKTGF